MKTQFADLLAVSLVDIVLAMHNAAAAVVDSGSAVHVVAAGLDTYCHWVFEACDVGGTEAGIDAVVHIAVYVVVDVAEDVAEDVEGSTAEHAYPPADQADTAAAIE